jgi:hypothetical protein
VSFFRLVVFRGRSFVCANDFLFLLLFRPLLAEEVAKSAVWMLQQPEKISIKALDVVPSAQRSLSVFDRQWTERRQGS